MIHPSLLANEHRSRWLAAAVVGLSAALVLLLSLVDGPQTIDDAFITYRYAANLAEGYGFVFNQGERVLGTTTPLYTLLLSFFALLGFDVVQVSLVIGALAGAGSVCLVYLYTQHIGGTRLTAGFVAVLLAVALPVTMDVGNGMEVHLFVLLVLCALVLASSGRPNYAMTAASLSALTRPEGAIAIVLILILIGFRQRSALKSSIGITAATIAPWVVAASLYFGSPIPNSVQAKSGNAFSLVAALPEGQAGRRLLDHFNQNLLGKTWDFLAAGNGDSVWTLMWILPLVFVALAAMRLARCDIRSIPLIGFPAGYTAFHFLSSALGVPTQDWYMSPLNPFLLSLSMTGVQIAAHYLFRVHWPSLSSVGFVLILTGQVATLDFGNSDVLKITTKTNVERERLYKQVAVDLEPEVDSSTVIAAPEIGALGYHSSASVLDTIGLVSPEVSGYYPIDPSEAVVGIQNAVPSELILELRPDYVVSLEVFIRNSLLKSEEFDMLYSHVASYPTSKFGSKGLSVFRINKMHDKAISQSS